MSRRVRRVPVQLDAKGVEDLPAEDVRMILRGADDLIMSGGRNLLVLVLKGSHARQVREHGLENSPAHGYYRGLSQEVIRARVDWMILRNYLDLEYDYRLPLLVYSPKGWAIECETYAEELLQGFNDLLRRGPPFDMTYLRDRNRDMIHLLLDKVEATGDPKYVPLLEAWAEVDYKKVRKRIGRVLELLTGTQS